jgi:alpha-tubulin suppressor-like RCC1 family protein
MPALVPGLADVVSAAGGNKYAVALRRDGTVWVWGWGWGAGGPAEGWPEYAVRRDPDGTFWISGWRDLGRLGGEPPADGETPEQVGGLSEVATISAGVRHAVALRKDGTVWAWGANGDCQLGFEARRSSAAPVRAVGIGEEGGRP